MERAELYRRIDARVDRMSYDQCKRAVTEMSRWARSHWKHCQHRTLIENAGYGAAVSWALFLLIMLAALGNFLLVRRSVK